MKMTQLTQAILISLIMVIGTYGASIADKMCVGPCPEGGIEALNKTIVYPSFAQEAKIEGTVILDLTIDEKGHVSHIEILQSAGDLLNKSAIQAILNASWNPAQQNGEAVASTLRLPFQFRLS